MLRCIYSTYIPSTDMITEKKTHFLYTHLISCGGKKKINFDI